MNADSAIVKLDTARAALAECKTVMEAKQIADVAEAARIYLERTNASAETVNRATEIRLLAERQMGEFLKQMPKATGVRMAGKDEAGVSVVTDGNRRETLAEIGITKKQSSRAQKLASIPREELQERVAVAKASGGKLSTNKILNFADAPAPKPRRGRFADILPPSAIPQRTVAEVVADAPEFSDAAKRAGDEAAAESDGLWRLKSLWNKTNKKDRAAFIAWIHAGQK